MKFSVITPVYNGERYIIETIESVVTQAGDFDIEYIVRDGGSTDSTPQILAEYERKINSKEISIECRSVTFKWFSEKDNGMYDAINKGFGVATGNIYAWINSDDMYMPNAFNTIKNVFTTFSDVEWVKGLTKFIDKSNNVIGIAPSNLFNRGWIESGIYGTYAPFINQDSVFWRNSLWKKSGGINPSLKVAGDYELWVKFAKFTKLWTIDTPVSMFRYREGQLSEDMDRYRSEQASVINPSDLKGRMVMVFFWIKNTLYRENRSKTPHLLYKILFRKRNKEYINVSKNKVIRKVKAYSYLATNTI